MRTLLTSLSVAAAVLGVSAISAANAQTITIGLQETGVNGGAITTVASGAGTASVATNSVYGTYTFNSLSGTTIAPSALDLSNTINTSTSGGTIFIYVTASGLTSPYPTGVANLTSVFQGNLVDTGLTVFESTLVSSANALFTGALVASNGAGFNGNAQSSTSGPTPTTVGSGPYSVTDVYEIVAGAITGTVNANISLTGTQGNREGVPGPVAGAGLPGLVLALGIGGFLVWRRRQSQGDGAGHALVA